MKNMRRSVKYGVIALVLILAAAVFSPVCAQAAVKKVKKVEFKTKLDSTIKKKALTVKKGTTTYRVSPEGYLKFKAPKTKTYSFKFSSIKPVNKADTSTCGHGYLQFAEKTAYSSDVYLKNQKFKTRGGETSTYYLGVKKPTTVTNELYAYFTSRTCKLKVKKGQTVYIYNHFTDPVTLKLTIK